MNQSPSSGKNPEAPMYPSPLRPSAAHAGLARYGSAPGSLLASLADSVINGGSGACGGSMSRFFAGSDSPPCLTSESSCRAGAPPDLDPSRGTGAGAGEIQRGGAGDGSHLIRQSSSPAGFFSHLLMDNSLSATKGIGNYSQAGTDGVHAMTSRRLCSQWSFSRQDSLSQISEISIPDIGDGVNGSNSTDEASGNIGQSYISSNVPFSSWDESNSIVFSAPSSKKARDNNGDLITSLSNIDSQFSLPSASLEMDNIETFLQMQHDSAPCKSRAKRGCATHPRSIAERERRTRISKKLRKLQELVPNMDKQTNTSDMLELAVQHIKDLQSQIQMLNQEKADCRCASKQELA